MNKSFNRLSRKSLLISGLILAIPVKAASANRKLAADTGTRRADDLISRDEPLLSARVSQSGFRVLDPRLAPRFSMVGLHWRGEGTVWYRVAGQDGIWSPWERAFCCEQPDSGMGEPAPPKGWHFGKPAWTGDSEWIQYQLRGDVSALRAHFFWSEPSPLLNHRVALVDSPSILSRASWNANERIVRADPYYADALNLALVHHTAGGTPANPDESGAIVKGIQRYHVTGNGWNDIGYNFLVDPFGQIFEGRGGGIDRNVVGAHARGFNTGAVGVAILGDYRGSEGTPTDQAIAGLSELLAWRLDVGHIEPATLRTIISGGTSRYPAGEAVQLRTISGHRDTDFTSCPGNNLYSYLDDVAVDVASIGLPKLYDPAVEGELGELVRITGRLSEDLAWVVTITDAAGEVVGSGEGNGTAIDWTWDSTLMAEEGSQFTYTVSAGDSVRSAIGVIVEEEAALPELPQRPRGVPRRVPRWAWQINLWHSTPRRRRGRRPKNAPKRLPKWYWKWRRWRIERARVARLIRNASSAGDV